MGRHKDPEIINLIRSLKSRGESWGFIADDEFKILDGLYWVDLIWKYREDHNLFITFEFEKEENEYLLKNLDKIFDTPSLEVEKPYHHFLIVFDGALSSGMKKIVEEKTRRHNIHVFENLKNVSSELDRLNKELEQLKIELPDLIKRRGKIDSANVVHDILRGLKDVVPVLGVKGHLYPISQSTLTSSAITISQAPLSASPIGAFDSTRYEGVAVIPIPRKRFVMVIPDTSTSLEVFLIQKEEDDKEIRLSFKTSELPCTLNFNLMKDGKGGGFHISLDPTLADVVHIKKFEDLLRAYDKRKSLLVMDMGGKAVMGCEGISLAKPLSSNEWYEAISDLAYIQDVTSHRIPCPKDLRISPRDLAAVRRMKNIIETGEEVSSIQALTFTTYEEQLEELVRIQEDIKKIPNLSLHHEQYSVNLLGEELLLGPVTWQLPDMIFREPLEEVKKRISGIEPKVPIEMTMIPLSNNETKITYHKCKK